MKIQTILKGMYNWILTPFLIFFKKGVAFFFEVVYSISCQRGKDKASGTREKHLNKWSVGQAAKTSPSHGENRGSIPLQTALFIT